MRDLFIFVSVHNRERAIACLVIGAILAVLSLRVYSAPVELRDEDGDMQSLYRGSYALLVGVSHYTNGWHDLDQIPGELRKAKLALESHGFDVTLELERTSSEELRDVYQEFINQHGYNEDNRLVFIFSGHGHTWIDGNQGYLVPSDAPKPAPDGNPGVSFLRKTIHISQMVEWSLQMTAKHALFLFDSCFSGTIFQTRGSDNAPKPSRFRFESASRPVRQFITAGSANETVPAKSVFMPAFVDAITLGEGDYSGDGIVTGNELGLYLESEVPQFAEQSPQFGRHPVRNLAKGNFVFVLDSRNINILDDRARAAQLAREERAMEELIRQDREEQAAEELARSNARASVAPASTEDALLNTPEKKISPAPNIESSEIEVVRGPIVDGNLFKSYVTIGGDVFDSNSANLNKVGERTLPNLLATLEQFDEISEILVTGHSDNRGAASYNHALSERRANALMAFIADAYPNASVMGMGMGESKPIAANSTPEGRQKNRRVEIEILSR